MKGVDAVEVEKLGVRFRQACGVDEVADRPEKRVVSLAEVEAGGFHFAVLRFDVAPIRPDHHWLKDSVKIRHPPRSESGLQAENEPL